MSMFRNLMLRATESGPDTFICKIKNTENSAVTPYIAFPVRSAYAGIPSIEVTIETSSGQRQTLTITGADLTTENDTASFALGRIDYFSAVSMAQDETATVTLYSKSKQFPSFSFCSSTNGYHWGKANARLYEVNTPLPVFVDGFCGSVFVGSLLTSFPNDLFQYGGSIKELNYTFAYSSLVTVPADLFNGMSKVTKALYLFRDSNKLTTLPEGLFSGMPEVTNLSYCFYSCSALTSVPEGLFDGITKVTNLYNLFGSCSRLVSIPAGLFSGMPEVTNLSYCFYSCSALTSVPEGLFDGITKVTNLYGLFMGCRSLATVPAGLFDDMTEVTDLGAMFWNCTGLTSVPEGLFDGMTKVTSMSTMFVSCYKLTTVPAGLFDDMTEVTRLDRMFIYCTGLTSVPEGLFRNLTKATSFAQCFYQVSASAIHANIFCDEATEKATRFANVTPNFSNCFADLKGTVAGTAPALWEYTYKATPTKTGCFSSNSTTTLSNYGDIPTEWIS